jgi:predicted transcriptional regulator
MFQYLKGACLKTITYYIPTKSDTNLCLAQSDPISKEEMNIYYKELKESWLTS